MSTVRFKSHDVALELSGSEAFVVRQLALFAPYLGSVDAGALEGFEPGRAPRARPAAGEVAEPVDSNGRPAAAEPDAATAEPTNGQAGLELVAPEAGQDGLRAFLDRHPPRGRDRQTDAALLIAYYLQVGEQRASIRMGDLVGSCIRAGIDTRNLNRPIGVLTRRGLLEEAPGNTYRISRQGVQAVEGRL